MRIAWVSPLPPVPSGISDYSYELLPLIAREASIDVFAEQPAKGRLRAPDGVAILPPEALRARAGDYDVVFHHLGNNPWHEFVYRLAVDLPGVAVLHDFVLHHLLDHVFFGMGRLDAEHYREIAQAEYGDLGPRLTRLRLRGAFTYLEMFLFPLSGHVVGRSRAVVVHSHDTAGRVRELAPHLPLWVIPHHAGTPPPEVAGVTREEARQRLGLPPRAFLVGQFGFITKPKQPAAVLDGFARLLLEESDALLLLVGENQVALGFTDLIARHRVGGHVLSTGYVDLVRFYLYLKAVDVVVNLRYPTAGEASGTFARALAEGRATIASDIGSLAEVPGDVTMKVEVDSDQAEQVGAHLVRLARDGPFRRALEERARSYARAALNQTHCAELYLSAAAEISTSPRAAV